MRQTLPGRIAGWLQIKRINEVRRTPGAPVWQRNYYEHIIRNDRELAAIRRYIRHNPLQWSLAARDDFLANER